MSEKNKLKLSVIITARNLDNWRIQRCIDSVKEHVKEVIVMDYGSKKPVDVKDALIFRYDKNPVWNKSHALNYAIKNHVGQPFIMNIDADIVVTKDIMEKIPQYLKDGVFVYNTEVRRINPEDVPNWEKSWDWYNNGNNLNKIRSLANGGIQLYSKRWIEFVRGYDEDLILWGAEDNDIFNRAVLSGLTMVNLNSPMYHQEHSEVRNEYTEKEKEIAKFIRKEKSNYIIQKAQESQIIGKERWGDEEPNQSKYIKFWENWDEEIERFHKEREKSLEKIRETILNNRLPIKSVNVDWQNE